MMPNPPEVPPEAVPQDRLSDEITRSGRPGTRCGSYALVELIDCGGFSEVWKARHEVVGHLAAVKLLRPNQTGAEVRNRFQREVELVAEIKHENVVSFLDSGFCEMETGERVLWLALELLDGASLRARLNEGERFTPEEALRIGYEICCGVGEAHRLNVVHRDLKPENVILTGAGVVKVLDFGIAKFYGWGFRTTGRMRGALGTPSYMSPEQMKGEAPPTFASDVFQIGLIVYELCAGRPPFSYANGEMPTHAQLFELRAHASPPPLSELGVEPEVSAVVDRALRPDPLERFATAGELGAAFWAVLRELRRRREAGGAAVAEVSPASSTGEPLGPLARRVYHPATTPPAAPVPPIPSRSVKVKRWERTAPIEPEGRAPTWREALPPPPQEANRRAPTRPSPRAPRAAWRARASVAVGWLAPRAVPPLITVTVALVVVLVYRLVPWQSLVHHREPSPAVSIAVSAPSAEPSETSIPAAPVAPVAVEPPATAVATASAVPQAPAQGLGKVVARPQASPVRPKSEDDPYRAVPVAPARASAAPGASAVPSATAAPSAAPSTTSPRRPRFEVEE